MKNQFIGTDDASFQKYVGGIDTKFIHDGANVVADYNASNSLIASYLTPFLDQNLIIITGSNTYYYFQDGLGSVRNLLDSSQTIQNTYDYFAFGEILSQTENIPQRYKFTSREWDAESSTYYYRARYYTPTVGRFTARDSIGYLAGLNLYSYVQSNPLNYVDPFGLQAESGSSVQIRRRPDVKRSRGTTDVNLPKSDFLWCFFPCKWVGGLLDCPGDTYEFAGKDKDGIYCSTRVSDDYGYQLLCCCQQKLGLPLRQDPVLLPPWDDPSTPSPFPPPFPPPPSTPPLPPWDVPSRPIEPPPWVPPWDVHSQPIPPKDWLWPTPPAARPAEKPPCK